ncbi:MAG: ABC transporter substrate-binding protein [Gammaproteobacteria bacterium]|nr:ABC transporter substrate-binding protein [Gammaproteobacteria bacterium]NIR83496.1 ABC transporter substrate-binding protein [Gammaproteobacteria bacterium]NIR91418.1 ABC transporter substrate-binding protein [Gammaproteobacteria bacterium]NIU04658.1 ABC transporter substrate-binding protein [Gammaproteobacteria bacterium]NIV51700.1 ABC transporter substrate-binding protein [Gammaproteobacteria bacterium]
MATALVLVGLTAPASAAEVTLRAVSAFAEGTTFSRNFERFIGRVNAKGQGVVRLEYLGGGGKVMNPFELGKAIQTGIVDVGNLPGAYYTNLVPEADAIKLSEFTIREERQNGAWEYMNRLHMQKMNAYHLARQKDCVPFNLYLNKKIDEPDLDGLKIRTTPIYSAFFSSLGATMLRTAPGEVYTALERGTVDGYGWPVQGVLDLGWHEVTEYRVEPSFYRASVEVLINADTWRRLGDDQKDVLREAADWLESLCGEDRRVNERERQRQAEAGIEVITFPEDVSRGYVEQAYDAGWAAFIEANPEHGAKLKELLSE